jgi:predicted RNase H-like nuclease (RuvC/YqgF family)
VASIDQKVHALKRGYGYKRLCPGFEKTVEEFSQKAVDADTNCSKLRNDLDGLSSRVELKDSSFETILMRRKNINDLEKKIAEVEKSKPICKPALGFAD